MALDGVGRAFLTREAVLEHERGDAVLSQPVRDVDAFVPGAQHAVTAAGDDQHRRAGGLVLGRQEDGDRWTMHLGDVAVLVHLGRGLALRPRRSAGPQWDLRLTANRGATGGERDHEGEQQQELG